MFDFFSVVLLVVIFEGVDTACTNQDACRNEYTLDRKFYRTYWGLTEVPHDINAEALKIYLHYNAITTIPTGVFSHLSQCTDLLLTNNKISRILDAAFRGMGSLQNVLLGQNRISSVAQSTFIGLQNLQQLGLQGNQIADIRPGTFDHLKSLNLVWLDRNRLSTLTPGVFDGLHSLQEIILNSNRLTTLNPEVFTNLPRPLVLRLSAIPTDQWDCSSLCWLKREEQHGTVTWWNSVPPKCTQGTWVSLQCGDAGRLITISVWFFSLQLR